jgi:hypothetical protein
MFELKFPTTKGRMTMKTIITLTALAFMTTASYAAEMPIGEEYDRTCQKWPHNVLWLKNGCAKGDESKAVRSLGDVKAKNSGGITGGGGGGGGEGGGDDDNGGNPCGGNCGNGTGNEGGGNGNGNGNGNNGHGNDEDGNDDSNPGGPGGDGTDDDGTPGNSGNKKR